MKKLNKIFMLVACVAIGMMVSCTQDQTNDVTQEEDLKMSLYDTEMGRAMVEKVGEVRANEIMQQMNNPMRFPIAYEGELCPGVANAGEAVYRGYSDFANADFWYFSGDAGDVVDIQVDRVNCDMDPVVRLYSGFGDTTSLIILGQADDNNGQACPENCFSYTDPLLSGVVLPSTGDYTVAVWDFIGGACTSGPQAYSVTATGFSCDADGDGCNDDVDPHPNSNQDATVNIDGCDSGVDNVFVTDCSTMNDLIADCAAAAGNHGDFVSCVAHLTNEWKDAGLISGREKGKIQRCAAQSSLP